MRRIQAYSELLGKKGLALAGFSFAMMIGQSSTAYATDNHTSIQNKIHTISLIKNNYDTKDQTITIKGTVIDEKGVPLSGVVVMVPNTTIASQTDFDGNYTITVPENTKTLLFSYLGFEDQTITIGKNLTLNIVMKENIEELGEVVVTGYQTISKERSTGSFAQVEAEQIQTRPAATNILERIEGSAAGINYTNGSVTVRGGSSMLLGQSPLIVVDGFPITGGIETVNPEDVATVTVLKDASAASIWGVAASNGVIVITTKKGKAGQKLTVEVSAFTSMTEQIDYNENDWMSTSDQLDMLLEYDAKGWFQYDQKISRKQAFTGFELAKLHLLGLAPDGDVWSQSQFDNYINSLRNKEVIDDWKKYLTRTPVLQTYNLSLSSAGERNSTYASLVFNDQKDAAIGDAEQRLIFNMNDTYKFSDKVRFSAAVTATYQQELNNGMSVSSVNTYEGYEALVDDYGQPTQFYRAYDPWTSKEREAANGIHLGFNPIEQQRANDNSYEALDIRARFGLEAEILKDLTFATNFQYENSFEKYDNFYSMDEYNQRYKVSRAYVDGVYQYPVGTNYRFTEVNEYSWNFRNTLNWDKTFGKHKITLFGGAEVRKIFSETTSDSKYGYNKQTTQSVPINQQDFQAGRIFDWYGNRMYDTFWNTYNSDRRQFSVFANGAYEFDSRYAINGSFRIDQANLFGSDPDFRYKPLWSAGFAWNITNESFVNIDWVDMLRMRATIGVNGNASSTESPYAQAANYVTSWGANLYDMLRFTKPENQQLKWEETRTFNLGLDFSLFANAIGGTIEYYNKNSTDLLGNVTLDPTVGFTSARLNYASMINRGVEVTLNANILQGDGFNWRTSANISYNHNEVTDILDQKFTPYRIATGGDLAIGSPLNNLYSYNYAGLDNAGVIQLVDPNGGTKSWDAGVEDKSELLYHGTTVAPWYGGLTNTFNYKGIDLTLNLTYKFGHVFRRSHDNSYTNAYNRPDNIWVNRWQEPGDELTTRVPKIPYNGTNPYNGVGETFYDGLDADLYYSYSQDLIYKADFIRVRDIILGYTLPKSFTDQTFFTNLKFSFNVTNPFLWVANDPGYDPEYAYTQAYNNLKTYTFGLRATF
ncbi:SusC/RagA family TonB-linked outer membrane protein [Robertkochia solimangrovi]|uniref:SusC/RagA family TonB-linked outer membrane protein n=1 Tax=Robertkochia solimangrovi TaxID=2213046 RepID=UPI00117F3776|nr:SusC/RagA family TonB-linked outer membrane protein [Robertkochia solimangrovi]TRZ45733.1 hypothetical protein DMZ48_00175 [Robertkochia solimangrovi]